MPKYLLCLLLLLASCGKQPSSSTLTIQASSTPHAEILQVMKQELQKEGIELKILVVDDYNLPNRALAEREIDGNFFQHLPFLQEQIEAFDYPLVPLIGVHVEPMGLYGDKELKEGALVTIPSDPTNETRALLLLERAGLITLSKRQKATLLDIQENPKHLRFKEIDAALLVRTLQEVGASVIPGNYALLGGLSPQKDALLLEDASSLYVNVIAIREEDEQRRELLALKRVVRSEAVRAFIEEISLTYDPKEQFVGD